MDIPLSVKLSTLDLTVVTFYAILSQPTTFLYILLTFSKRELGSEAIEVVV